MYLPQVLVDQEDLVAQGALLVPLDQTDQEGLVDQRHLHFL